MHQADITCATMGLVHKSQLHSPYMGIGGKHVTSMSPISWACIWEIGIVENLEKWWIVKSGNQKSPDVTNSQQWCPQSCVTTYTCAKGNVVITYSECEIWNSYIAKNILKTIFCNVTPFSFAITGNCRLYLSGHLIGIQLQARVHAGGGGSRGPSPLEIEKQQRK